MKIGIDPDLRANGVAVVEFGQITMLETMTFVELMEFIDDNRHCEFYLEDVNKHRALYASRGKYSMQVQLKIAQNVGMVKAMGTIIEQYLIKVDATYTLVTPLKGPIKKAKSDAKMFNRITGWDSRSNQDTRDAALLLFEFIKNKPQ